MVADARVQAQLAAPDDQGVQGASLRQGSPGRVAGHHCGCTWVGGHTQVPPGLQAQHATPSCIRGANDMYGVTGAEVPCRVGAPSRGDEAGWTAAAVVSFQKASAVGLTTPTPTHAPALLKPYTGAAWDAVMQLVGGGVGGAGGRLGTWVYVCGYANATHPVLL